MLPDRTVVAVSRLSCERDKKPITVLLSIIGDLMQFRFLYAPAALHVREIEQMIAQNVCLTD